MSDYVKQNEWNVAIGLQKVDDLTPSKYLENIINDNINEKISLDEAIKNLKSYYIEQGKNRDLNLDELECDFVVIRMVELFRDKRFELSVDYLKFIHQFLFQDVYDFAGQFRDINFSKEETILNNDSVAYSDFKVIEDSLDYDITLERNKYYSKFNIVDKIKNISDFSASIWQVHPFREGNTRCTAVFIGKYLNYLGFNVDNNLFQEKAVYYRNALVRANYFNNEKNIKEDNRYLIKFYENLLLDKNNNLCSEELIVKELF